MIEYTWEIKSADKSQNSLVVEYSANDKTICLNLPYPTMADVAQHVQSFAPLSFFKPRDSEIEVSVGQRGIGQAQLVPEDTPNMNGNWNEEYIRAMIYQVMEEIREVTV